ncbi:p-nitrophenyl phosphatase [Exophiala dermatitidis]|uniref:4-nitrophenylphosphatase n=2 Tax=Exophiala dermatitidis TaxID=5970 RepID=H6C107_EXODN|nr:4-nitrophenyl phosphatase [Exophiala dermatitidis NIH/UT8656]KAJ4516762.1 p-nitrophenyl phosphatase [Exophiala dermatitidis]EHY57345.1 4-nitrophenyl phosphatase [Exophiala dermatitidis NIH/UT8656]KAJ4520735.1 p-nitrophenyl phosphatase [Exophiala dermatitidis]KAJ4521877.1 p-nitrophenyl phosphatase [Exophiala dermatitidis]KAJ4535872.1 p-nitrophenyl phosphatase [Exophiala dermatitidis]
MSTPEHLTGNKDAIRQFIDKYDVFLFDCDGVLWSGDHLFPGSVPTLEMLRKKNKRIVFVTNNSTKSREEYRKKLESMGIPATVEEVFGSSYSAAIYISRILPQTHPEIKKRNKVFVIGEAGIETELASEGIEYLGGTDPKYRRDVTPEDYKLLAKGDPSVLDPDVGVVLVGLDFHFNYLKLCYAYHYIKRGALFLATNLDSTLPSAGALFPGAGSVVAPLVKMLGCPEPMAFGKPNQAMMDAIEGKFHFDREKACMVGDRTNTDIRFGREGKLGGTLGVLTGVATKEEFLEGEVRPHYYVDKLGDLLEGA